MSLRHVATLFTLPIAYYVAAISTEEKRRAVQSAFGPSLASIEQPSQEQLVKEQIESKKRGLKSGFAFIVVQVAVFCVLFFTFKNHPDASNWWQLVWNTLFVGVVSYTALQYLLGLNNGTTARTVDGKLVPGYARSLTNRTFIPLVFASLSILPLSILSRDTVFVLPTASLAAMVFVVFFGTLIVGGTNFTLRWLIFLNIAFEALAVFIGLAIFALVESPIGAGIREWAQEGSEEKKDKLDLKNPYLEELVQTGISSLHPFIYLGILGWIVTGLYRLDLSLARKEAPLTAHDDETDDFARLPAVPTKTSLAETASDKEKKKALAAITGERVVLPSLAASLVRHKSLVLQSVPVYFLTGVGTIVGLMAGIPIIMGLFLPLSPQESKLDYYVAELGATLLATPVLAIVLTLVGLVRGEIKEVWTYREVWGGVKPAPEGEESTAVSGGEEEEMREKV